MASIPAFTLTTRKPALMRSPKCLMDAKHVGQDYASILNRYFPSLPFESLTAMLLMCDHQVNSYFSGVRCSCRTSPAVKEVKARQSSWAAS